MIDNICNDTGDIVDHVGSSDKISDKIAIFHFHQLKEAWEEQHENCIKFKVENDQLIYNLEEKCCQIDQMFSVLSLETLKSQLLLDYIRNGQATSILRFISSSFGNLITGTVCCIKIGTKWLLCNENEGGPLVFKGYELLDRILITVAPGAVCDATSWTPFDIFPVYNENEESRILSFTSQSHTVWFIKGTEPRSVASIIQKYNTIIELASELLVKSLQNKIDKDNKMIVEVSNSVQRSFSIALASVISAPRVFCRKGWSTLPDIISSVVPDMSSELYVVDSEWRWAMSARHEYFPLGTAGTPSLLLHALHSNDRIMCVDKNNKQRNLSLDCGGSDDVHCVMVFPLCSLPTPSASASASVTLHAGLQVVCTCRQLDRAFTVEEESCLQATVTAAGPAITSWLTAYYWETLEDGEDVSALPDHREGRHLKLNGNRVSDNDNDSVADLSLFSSYVRGLFDGGDFACRCPDGMLQAFTRSLHGNWSGLLIFSAQGVFSVSSCSSSPRCRGNVDGGDGDGLPVPFDLENTSDTVRSFISDLMRDKEGKTEADQCCGVRNSVPSHMSGLDIFFPPKSSHPHPHPPYFNVLGTRLTYRYQSGERISVVILVGRIWNIFPPETVTPFVENVSSVFRLTAENHVKDCLFDLAESMAARTRRLETSATAAERSRLQLESLNEKLHACVDESRPSVFRQRLMNNIDVYLSDMGLECVVAVIAVDSVSGLCWQLNKTGFWEIRHEEVACPSHHKEFLMLSDKTCHNARIEIYLRLDPVRSEGPNALSSYDDAVKILSGETACPIWINIVRAVCELKKRELLAPVDNTEVLSVGDGKTLFDRAVLAHQAAVRAAVVEGDWSTYLSDQKLWKEISMAGAALKALYISPFCIENTIVTDILRQKSPSVAIPKRLCEILANMPEDRDGMLVRAENVSSSLIPYLVSVSEIDGLSSDFKHYFTYVFSLSVHAGEGSVQSRRYHIVILAEMMSPLSSYECRRLEAQLLGTVSPLLSTSMTRHHDNMHRSLLVIIGTGTGTGATCSSGVASDVFSTSCCDTVRTVTASIRQLTGVRDVIEYSCRSDNVGGDFRERRYFVRSDGRMSIDSNKIPMRIDADDHLIAGRAKDTFARLVVLRPVELGGKMGTGGLYRVSLLMPSELHRHRNDTDSRSAKGPPPSCFETFAVVLIVTDGRELCVDSNGKKTNRKNDGDDNNDYDVFPPGLQSQIHLIVRTAMQRLVETLQTDIRSTMPLMTLQTQLECQRAERDEDFELILKDLCRLHSLLCEGEDCVYDYASLLWRDRVPMALSLLGEAVQYVCTNREDRLAMEDKLNRELNRRSTLKSQLKDTRAVLEDFTGAISNSAWKYTDVSNAACCGETFDSAASTDEGIVREELVAATAFNSKALRRLTALLCDMGCHEEATEELRRTALAVTGYRTRTKHVNNISISWMIPRMYDRTPVISNVNNTFDLLEQVKSSGKALTISQSLSEPLSGTGPVQTTFVPVVVSLVASGTGHGEFRIAPTETVAIVQYTTSMSDGQGETDGHATGSMVAVRRSLYLLLRSMGGQMLACIRDASSDRSNDRGLCDIGRGRVLFDSLTRLLQEKKTSNNDHYNIENCEKLVSSAIRGDCCLLHFASAQSGNHSGSSSAADLIGSPTRWLRGRAVKDTEPVALSSAYLKTLPTGCSLLHRSFLDGSDVSLSSGGGGVVTANKYVLLQSLCVEGKDGEELWGFLIVESDHRLTDSDVAAVDAAGLAFHIATTRRHRSFSNLIDTEPDLLQRQLKSFTGHDIHKELFYRNTLLLQVHEHLYGCKTFEAAARVMVPRLQAGIFASNVTIVRVDLKTIEALVQSTAISQAMFPEGVRTGASTGSVSAVDLKSNDVVGVAALALACKAIIHCETGVQSCRLPSSFLPIGIDADSGWAAHISFQGVSDWKSFAESSPNDSVDHPVGDNNDKGVIRGVFEDKQDFAKAMGRTLRLWLRQNRSRRSISTLLDDLGSHNNIIKQVGNVLTNLVRALSNGNGQLSMELLLDTLTKYFYFHHHQQPMSPSVLLLRVFVRTASGVWESVGEQEQRCTWGITGLRGAISTSLSQHFLDGVLGRRVVGPASLCPPEGDTSHEESKSWWMGFHLSIGEFDAIAMQMTFDQQVQQLHRNEMVILVENALVPLCAVIETAIYQRVRVNELESALDTTQLECETVRTNTLRLARELKDMQDRAGASSSGGKYQDYHELTLGCLQLLNADSFRKCVTRDVGAVLQLLLESQTDRLLVLPGLRGDIRFQCGIISSSDGDDDDPLGLANSIFKIKKRLSKHTETSFSEMELMNATTAVTPSEPMHMFDYSFTCGCVEGALQLQYLASPCQQPVVNRMLRVVAMATGWRVHEIVTSAKEAVALAFLEKDLINSLGII
eukprot:gene92-125_t